MAKATLAIPSYVQTLSSAIKQQLRHADVTAKHVRANRYQFEVIWDGFKSMDHLSRQRLVWDLAEATLKSSVVDVAMILTISPNELD